MTFFIKVINVFHIKSIILLREFENIEFIELSFEIIN